MTDKRHIFCIAPVYLAGRNSWLHAHDLEKESGRDDFMDARRVCYKGTRRASSRGDVKAAVLRVKLPPRGVKKRACLAKPVCIYLYSAEV